MTALLEAIGICKNYGHVEVLREVDFAVNAGEVTALIGDNGAGKSTLVKILSGTIPLDRGTILLEGKPITMSSPTAARDLGIETVYQDLALAPELGPAENTFAGLPVRADASVYVTLDRGDAPREYDDRAEIARLSPTARSPLRG